MATIDPDVQKYYEEYFHMFSTPGWQMFKEELAQALKQDQETAAQRCPTSDSWLTERGAQMKMQKMINFESTIKTQYDYMISEETDADMDEDA